MSESLPIGTLVLDPGNGDGFSRPAIWTVASKTTLTAAVEGLHMKATLTKAGLPKGWRVIDNRALAKHLAAAPAQATQHVLGQAAR